MLEVAKEGVGALIVQDTHFLTIEELHLSRRFRPGNREVILSYQKYLASSKNEHTLYVNTIDRISEEIFDLYKANQNKLQSQQVHFA